MLTSLHLGARVEGLNGDKLGNLKYLVADPASNAITHFVIERGGLDTDQLVVEATRVNAISDEGDAIRLDLSPEQLDQLPVFMEREYTNLGTLTNETREDTTTYATTYPSENYTGLSGVAGTGFLYPTSGARTDPVYDESTLATSNAPLNPNLAGPIEADTNGPVGLPYTEKLNVPENSLILRQGAEVEATDGKLGTVKDVNVDPSNGKLISFTVEKGFFFKDEFTVPAEMVESSTDKSVSLRVSKAELANDSYDQVNEPGYSHDVQ